MTKISELMIDAHNVMLFKHDEVAAVHPAHLTSSREGGKCSKHKHPLLSEILVSINCASGHVSRSSLLYLTIYLKS